MIGSSYSTGSINQSAKEKEKDFDFIKAGGYWQSQLAGIRRSAHMESLTIDQRSKLDKFGNVSGTARRMTYPSEAEVAQLWAAVKEAGSRNGVITLALASSETLNRALEGRRLGAETLDRLLVAAEKILKRAEEKRRLGL